MRVGVAGYGYWGPNLCRNVQANPRLDLAVICDLDPAARARAQQHHPGVIVHGFYDIMVENVDAVIVCTPPPTHHRLALDALASGRHVLVEKPLATSVAHALELKAASEAAGLVLMAGHTFVFHPAVAELRRIVERSDTIYFTSQRLSLGLFQPGANVIWDLLPHDLSILMHLYDAHPVDVVALGNRHHGRCTDAHVAVTLSNGLRAVVHVSWLSPVKVRRIQLGGPNLTAIYDDCDVTRRVQVYHSGAVPDADGRAEYRTGPLVCPHVPQTEALAVELDHWADVILEGRAPVFGLREACRIVSTLEACDRSLEAGGATHPVSVS